MAAIKVVADLIIEAGANRDDEAIDDDVLSYLQSMIEDDATTSDDFSESLCGFVPSCEGRPNLTVMICRAFETIRGLRDGADVKLPEAPSAAPQPPPQPLADSFDVESHMPDLNIQFANIQDTDTQGYADDSEGIGGGEKGEDERWECPNCTFQNAALLTICEMCEVAKPGEEAKRKQTPRGTFKTKSQQAKARKAKALAEAAAVANTGAAADVTGTHALSSVDLTTAARGHYDNNTDLEELVRFLVEARVSDPAHAKAVLAEEQMDLETILECEAADLVDIGLSEADASAIVNVVTRRKARSGCGAAVGCVDQDGGCGAGGGAQGNPHSLRQQQRKPEKGQRAKRGGNGGGGGGGGDDDPSAVLVSHSHPHHPQQQQQVVDEEELEGAVAMLSSLLPESCHGQLDRPHLEYVFLALGGRRLDEACTYLLNNVVEAPVGRQQEAVRKVINDSKRWRTSRLKLEQDNETGGSSFGQGEGGYGGGPVSSASAEILRRYDERPDDSRTTHRPLAHYSEGLAGGGPKGKTTNFRFLNGVKVAMKSGKDKYVVEEVGPAEWDGGSKGRVKTKGKRGPGFV